MGGVTVRHIVGCAVVIAATVICFDGAAFAVATDSDKEIANAAVYQTADFPAGWKTRTLPTSSKVLDGVPGCNALAKTYKKIDRVSTARGVSDGFERDDELHGSNIRVFRDEDTAKQIYVASTLDKSQECLANVVKSSAAKNAKEQLGSSASSDSIKLDSTVSEVTGSTLGDETSRFQIKVSASGDAVLFDDETFIDRIYVRVGRAIATYQRQSRFEPFEDDRFMEQLAATSVGRLRAGLTGQPITSPDAPAALGAAQVGSDGATVTVYGFQKDVPYRFAADQFGLAPAGSVWAVADAQVCAPAGATGEVDVSASAFDLIFTDNTRGETTFSGPGAPPLSFVTVRSGECVRGALNYAIPPGKALTQIIYDPSFGSSGRPARWSIA
jgi:hypothetical protein